MADGRWVSELSNWTGKAYKIPRTYVSLCEDREDLNHTGVYFLFGVDDDTEEQQVYIGEAENILTRMRQHVAGKDFWQECVAFISKDNNLNKAHIKYLENHLYLLARESKRYELLNAVAPTAASISEMDQAEMDEFIDNMRLILSVLGHKVLEPTTGHSREKGQLFFLKARSGAMAAGKPSSEGFSVMKDSVIAKNTAVSIPRAAMKKRRQLMDKGVIDPEFRFTQDWPFSSPSLAAAVVAGYSVNGQTAWKNKDGVSLKNTEIQSGS